MKVDLYTIVEVTLLIRGIHYFFYHPRFFPCSPFFMLSFIKVSAEVFKFILHNEAQIK